MAERPEPFAEPSGSDSPDPSAPSHGEDGGPPGIGARGVAVFLVVATLVASGLVLDRAVGPKAEAKGSSAGTQSGALSCPHGGRSGWQGWVVMTNPGRRPVRIRLTELGEEGARSVRTFAIGAFRQVYREVSADDPADGTQLEFFGGQVGGCGHRPLCGRPGRHGGRAVRARRPPRLVRHGRPHGPGRSLPSRGHEPVRRGRAVRRRSADGETPGEAGTAVTIRQIGRAHV